MRLPHHQATPDLIAKVPLFGKDLRQYSLETVKMLYEMPRQPGTSSFDWAGQGLNSRDLLAQKYT